MGDFLFFIFRLSPPYFTRFSTSSLFHFHGFRYETASAISLETAETLGDISTRGLHYSAVQSNGYGDRLDRLLDAVEKLADSQTTMEIDGRPFGRLVREYV